MNQALNSPLADRIRPRALNQIIGQSHLVGRSKPIRRMIEQGVIHSMIFWGPPGCGKTTLARLIAQAIDAAFIEISAVSAGKADMRRAVETANQTLINKKTIFFIDEIHRFNKAQQDFLLPYVEDGTLILIGATTENPSFEVISPLLSRTQVFVLEPISKSELIKIIQAGSRELQVALSDQAQDFLAEFANGDARQALNLLENTFQLYGVKVKKSRDRGGAKRREYPGIETSSITINHLKQTLQSKHLRYDTGGEEHYNTISAFIKSMRASNPDAALYYLARMVDAGEDPKFIARRMVIFASEDIGMAQPTALVVANSVFRAVETIGYPEAQINLAHGVTYLASAKKDRSAYDAYFAALDDVKKHGNLPIPLHLRNAPTKLMKDLGYSRGYEKYPKGKSLLPELLEDRKYYKS